MKKWAFISMMLAIALLASTTFWIGNSPKSSLVTPETFASAPNFFMQEMSSSRYDLSGKLVEKLEAQEAKHYQTQDGLLFLDKPNIQIHSQDASWIIQSNAGMAAMANNQITLTNKVKAVKDSNTDRQVTLMSDTLNYSSVENTLVSSGNVSVTSSQENIAAEKISTNLNSSTLTIEGSVRGTHETHN